MLILIIGKLILIIGKQSCCFAFDYLHQEHVLTTVLGMQAKTNAVAGICAFQIPHCVHLLRISFFHLISPYYLYGVRDPQLQ